MRVRKEQCVSETHTFVDSGSGTYDSDVGDSGGSRIRTTGVLVPGPASTGLPFTSR